MTKNEVIRLEITSVANDGSGVGRYEGAAVFVPFSAVGDILDCRVLKVLKNRAYAKIERIVSPSPDRIPPDCPAYLKCGGCCFRHISYAAELRAKAGFVSDAFRRIASLTPEFEPIIPAPSTQRYRNKAQMPVAEGEDGPVCGFYSVRSHRVIPCGDCLLAPKEFSDICKRILEYQKKKSLSCYDEITGSGLLRHIYLRRGHYSGETAVCLIVTRATHAYDGLAKELAGEFSDIKTVILNINPEKTNVITGEREIILYGGGRINDTICNIGVELSAKSFYQVNTPAAEAVYRKAAEYASLTGRETVLDLYCGAGTVGLSMAKDARRLIGVEVVPQAVENAKKNALRNGAKNAEFIAADAAEAAKSLCDRGERPDVVIVDPPRKGCYPATLAAIAEMSPERVVMISCDPATAARDCLSLTKAGYALSKVCPADMFPRTRHVETVCLLSKLNVKQHIEVELTMDEMDLTAAEKKASYEEIKEYVLEKFGMKVSHLYIAQVKRKCGIIERENYNKPKSENAKQPQCPPEKEAAIREALKHFRMI